MVDTGEERRRGSFVCCFPLLSSPLLNMCNTTYPNNSAVQQSPACSRSVSVPPILLPLCLPLPCTALTHYSSPIPQLISSSLLLLPQLLHSTRRPLATEGTVGYSISSFQTPSQSIHLNVICLYPSFSGGKIYIHSYIYIYIYFHIYLYIRTSPTPLRVSKNGF